MADETNIPIAQVIHHDTANLPVFPTDDFELLHLHERMVNLHNAFIPDGI